MSDPEPPRSPFEGSLQFDTEAWHRAGCPTLESAFVAWQAAEERANTAEAELRETAGELAEMARVHAGRTDREIDLIEQRQQALVATCTPAERAVLNVCENCWDEDHIIRTIMKWREDRARETLVPPLRTRAEVDAEIATTLRMALGAGYFKVISGTVDMTPRMEALCAEPLAPDPNHTDVMSPPDAPEPDECERGGECMAALSRPGHCAKCEREMPCRAPSPGGARCLLARGNTMAHDWHGSAPEPDRCSCEEALGLREKLREIADLTKGIGHVHPVLRAAHLIARDA